MRKPKVVIVGAGPAGAACAIALRRGDAAEVVLVDKSTYPRVKVCGSGLSPLALGLLDRMGMRARFRDRHAVLAGLHAKGPDGHVVRLAAGEGAWVVPREQLDHALASEAERLGATFLQGTKVVSLLRDAGGAVRGVSSTRGDFEADLVVCADGAPSRFSPDATPRTTVRTIMGWWEGTRCPADACVLVWDRRLDGYYAWAFPEPGGVTNVGLTIPETAPHAGRLKELFQELLDEHFADALRGAAPTRRWMGHPAVVTTRVGAVAEARALWVGEAARLVMPGTAEGIGFALESGLRAGAFVARHADPARGLSRLAREGFRASLAASVLPKFWAGDGFVRAMRSPRARSVGAALLAPRVQGAVARGLAALLGEAQATGRRAAER